MPELIECPWCADARSRALAEQVRVLREALKIADDDMRDAGWNEGSFARHTVIAALAATAPQPTEGDANP